MKKLNIFFGVVIFIFTFTAKAFSQENSIEALRFTHDFNIAGIKSEKQALWIDSVMNTLPQVISCSTNFNNSHTKLVVHETFNSPQLIQNIFVKLGFEVDNTSYVSKQIQ